MLHPRKSSALAALAAVMLFTLSTSAQIPGAPMLSSPSNGATNQMAAVTLSWAASTGAKTYGLQVSTISTFATVASNQTGISITSGSVMNLSYATTYYWRVNATDTTGSSVWSGIWSFTTYFTATPSLVSPTNGAINQLLSLTLNWNSVTAAASYALQVSSVSTFSLAVINQTGVTAKSAAISGLANSMNYYWRVYATGPYGTSNWSTIYSFVTALVAPAAPVLTYPSNNATDISYEPVFTWQQALNNTTTYTLQLSSTSNFSTIVSQGIGISSPWSSPALSFNATYYWQVNATNGLGASPWSSAWKFTVSAPIPTVAPTLISPSYEETILPSATFSWSTISGATSYVLKINYVDNGVYIDTITTNSWSNDDTLSLIMKYIGSQNGCSWAVMAKNGSGSGPWSPSEFAGFYLSTTSTLPSNVASSIPSLSILNASVLYTLTASSQVDVALFSLIGRRISILNRLQSSGSYTLPLKNRNLPAGVYFLQFKAGAIEKRMKIVLPGG